jgi:uncharacterized protein (TIGR02147 family)
MGLFDHTDYRDVLRDWLAAHPRRSQTSLARRVGVSRSQVAMVLAGERDVLPATSLAWGEGMGLRGDELTFWAALVRAEHGGSLAQRRAAKHQAAALADYASARRPSQREAELLGRWYVPVVLELQHLPDATTDPVRIAARLWPTPDLEELTATLACMAERGMFGEPADVATEAQIDDDLLAGMARRHHREQLHHASLALDQFDSAERYVSSLSLAIERSRLPELVERLHHLQLELVEPFRADAPDQVVQLCVQLFPRTRPDADHDDGAR